MTIHNIIVTKCIGLKFKGTDATDITGIPGPVTAAIPAWLMPLEILPNPLM